MWLVNPPKLVSTKVQLKWILKLYKTLSIINLGQTSYYIATCDTPILNKQLTTNYFLELNPKSVILKSDAISSFKSFVLLGSSSTNGLLKVHPSNKQFFLKIASSGGGFTSLRLLFNVYNKFNSLLFNVIYFDIKLLSFGNSVFRQEIAAINWGYITYYTTLLKLSNMSIFFKPNKLSDKLPKIFRFLKLNGFHTSIVYDCNYHKRTIYYLHRLNFFSIGIIPANMPKYTLSISLPTLNDTLLAHLFMLRLFVKMQRLSRLKLFNQANTLWYKL